MHLVSFITGIHHGGGPVPTRWEFHTNDPLAVSLSIEANGEFQKWVFGRDIVWDALGRKKPGPRMRVEGEVCLDEFLLTLRGKMDGKAVSATFSYPESDVRTFMAVANKVVPPGREKEMDIINRAIEERLRWF